MAQAFKDPNLEPTEASIQHALGEAAPVWLQLLAQLTAAGIEVGWRYYIDGGWLAKATKGKKTAAWMCVNEGFVQFTCYFPERHRELLETCPDLAPQSPGTVAKQTMVGRSIAASLQVRDATDVEQAATLANLKLAAR